MSEEDESLEILFWWVGDQPGARIEDDLDAHLAPAPRPRRRLLWPVHRSTAQAELST